MAFGLDLGNLLVHLKLDANQYIRTTKSIEKRLKVTAAKFESAGKRMSLYITAPLALMARSSVKAFSEFDLKMTESLAIMGNVSSGMQEEMSATARSLSLTGVKSSSELAESYFFLASAGLDAEQSIAALPQVLAFATAGAFDMAKATDLATDAQSSLGLTVKDSQQNLTNLTRVTDVLVKANSLANAKTEQFAKALTSDAGAAMKFMNIQVEEGVAVLSAYADQGIKAEEAGNMFGRMLRLMTKGFRDNRQAWKAANVDLFDVNGNYRDMADIIEDLTKSMANLSPESKSMQLDLLGFEARSQKAITPLLGMSKAIRGYHRDLKAAGGTTKNVAEKQLVAFANKMTIVKNHLIALKEDIGEQLQPAMIKIGNIIKTVTLWFIALDDSTKKSIISWGIFVAAVGPVLLSMGLLIKAILFIKAAIVSVTLLVSGMFPIVAIIAIIAAGIYSIATVWRTNFGGMRDVLQSFVEIFSEAWNKMASVFNKFLVHFQKFWQEALSHMARSLVDYAKDVIGVTLGIVNVLKNLTLGNTNISDNFASGFSGTYGMLDKLEKKLSNTFNNPILKADEFISKIDELGKVVKGATGQAFSELWSANINQAKSDMESFIFWLNNISKKLKPSDPAFEIVADLKSQTVGLLNIMDDIPQAVENMSDEVGDAYDGFTAETLAKFQDFQTSLQGIMEQSTMNMIKDWGNWKDSVMDMLEEVYYEAIRIALVKPFTEAAAGATASFGKQLFTLAGNYLLNGGGGNDNVSGDSGGYSSDGINTTTGEPTLASGGSVEKTGWAVVHEGETFSGVGNKLNGGDFSLKLHYEGQPLVATKQQTYLESDARIVEVWLGAADSNMSVRSKIRGVSQGG